MKALWADGLSASQIAAELGGGLSRNAVIGKVHRLGLSLRAARMQPKKTYKPRQKPQPRSFTRPVSSEPTLPNPPPEPPLPDGVIPKGQRCTLLHLTSKTCRWPIGDPLDADFYFCGEMPVVGDPYCAHHHGIAYDFMPSRSRYSYKDTSPRNS